jgi:hypothetical protein
VLLPLSSGNPLGEWLNVVVLHVCIEKDWGKSGAVFGQLRANFG